MNKLIFTATLVIISSLAGCANREPLHKAGESMVQIRPQIGDEMIAKSLDGVRAIDLNHFNVSSGQHSMELGVVVTDYQNSHRRCSAKLEYANFAPDARYTLMESSSGREVNIKLVDSGGVIVAQTDNVACL